jgi:hypothetical protein
LEGAGVGGVCIPAEAGAFVVGRTGLLVPPTTGEDAGRAVVVAALLATVVCPRELVIVSKAKMEMKQNAWDRHNIMSQTLTEKIKDARPR